MTDSSPPAPRKKSVALSGVVAANTALCTVGRTGNDLHYRGYDILEVAEAAEFEEIAHLLVHERLPTATELAAYGQKLISLRGLPPTLRKVLESLPASSHPMDVMRTGVSALGCIEPERNQTAEHARDLADRLIASLGSMLLYWYHFARDGVRIEVESEANSVAAHFLSLLHGRPATEARVRAMHTSLVLYAEHELNASTFAARVIAGTGSDLYSCIVGGIGALLDHVRSPARRAGDHEQRREHCSRHTHDVISHGGKPVEVREHLFRRRHLGLDGVGDSEQCGIAGFGG